MRIFPCKGLCLLNALLLDCCVAALGPSPLVLVRGFRSRVLKVRSLWFRSLRSDSFCLDAIALGPIPLGSISLGLDSFGFRLARCPWVSIPLDSFWLDFFG